MKRTIFSLLLILAFLIGTCCSNTNKPQLSKPQLSNLVYKDYEVIYDIGNPLRDPFPEVGAVYALDNSNVPYIIGSCVLIDTNICLTAAHVISSPNIKLTHVSFNGESGPKFEIQDLIPHENFVLSNDIGLIVLKNHVNHIVPVKINSAPLTRWDYGSFLVVCGYGDGIKKYSRDRMAWYYGTIEGEDLLRWLAIFGSLRYGDSGGGTYMMINGRLTLVGINALFRYSPDHSHVIDSGSTRVDMHHSWILDKIKGIKSP